MVAILTIKNIMYIYDSNNDINKNTNHSNKNSNYHIYNNIYIFFNNIIIEIIAITKTKSYYGRYYEYSESLLPLEFFNYLLLMGMRAFCEHIALLPPLAIMKRAPRNGH
jgi:hypothetical protein